MFKRYFFYSILILLLYGCDDPQRTNPLDSKSEFYQPNSTVIFSIRTKLNHPIADVSILLGSLHRVSDSDGLVRFTNVEPGVYNVFIESESISSDTILNFDVPIASVVQRSIVINRLPIIDSISVVSELRSSGINNKRCHFYAKAYDLDGRYDIDTFTVQTPYGVYQLYSTVDSTFHLTIDSLPTGLPIQNLIGFPLTFRAKDNLNGVSISHTSLARVFSGNPFLLSPLNNAVDNVSEFYVEWFASSSDPFLFYFRVLIFHYASGVEVYRIEDIPQNQYRINLFNVLPSGFYLVEVQEVDLFGNFSRSQRNAFQLVNSIN